MGKSDFDQSQLICRSIHLRDASRMKATVEAVLQLVFSDYCDVWVPSAATISRARRKIDLAYMFLRRFEWIGRGIKNHSIQLSFSVT